MSSIIDRELVRHLSQGKTANQIADELGVGVRTVNYRLQLLYAMYGVPAGNRRNIQLLNAMGYIKEPSE
jgi:DNA-binding NarL/FixJ family response regulator